MSETKFCPLIREKCYGEKCVFWHENGCIITRFFIPPELETLKSETTEVKVSDTGVAEKERRVLEELEEEIKSFIEKEFPGGVRRCME